MTSSWVISVLLCFGTFRLFSYISGLLHSHCWNIRLPAKPVEQPWNTWVNRSHESTMKFSYNNKTNHFKTECVFHGVYCNSDEHLKVEGERCANSMPHKHCYGARVHYMWSVAQRSAWADQNNESGMFGDDYTHFTSKQLYLRKYSCMETRMAQ